MKSVKRNSTLMPTGADTHEPIKKPKLASSNIKLPNPVPNHAKTTPRKNCMKYHKEINDDHGQNRLAQVIFILFQAEISRLCSALQRIRKLPTHKTSNV